MNAMTTRSATADPRCLPARAGAEIQLSAAKTAAGRAGVRKSAEALLGAILFCLVTPVVLTACIFYLADDIWDALRRRTPHRQYLWNKWRGRMPAERKPYWPHW